MATGMMRALGLMSGTSYDALDVALIETDGDAAVTAVSGATFGFAAEERALIARATEDALAWGFEGDAPASFQAAVAAVTAAHARAAAAFLATDPAAQAGPRPSLIGFHGQTVLHRPPANRPGATLQLGDAQALADLMQIPVVWDFRRADVEAGGHGAPLSPIYHWARGRMSGLGAGDAVLNLGGVANISFLQASPDDLVAFDTGPANGLLDQWVAAHGAGDCDRDGAYARAGRVDAATLAALLDHRHFDMPPPKSLDRYAFALAPLEGLSLEDGCATLTAFTAHTVARALRFAPSPVARVVAAGGGVDNPALMTAIAAGLRTAPNAADGGARLDSAVAWGWRADTLEAELMAYLAVRSQRGAALTFPKTTGVAAPQTGGRCATPRSDVLGPPVDPLSPRGRDR